MVKGVRGKPGGSGGGGRAEVLPWYALLAFSEVQAKIDGHRRQTEHIAVGKMRGIKSSRSQENPRLPKKHKGKQWKPWRTAEIK